MTTIDPCGENAALHAAFAPVHLFKLDPDCLGQGYFAGLAAPTYGPKPCLVKLVSGVEVLAVARADGFSLQAAAEKIRFGWCAFACGGVNAAIALGDQVELQCALTSRSLVSWSSDELHRLAGPGVRRGLSVAGLRAFVKALSGCLVIEQIEPFTANFAPKHSAEELIRVMWEYFLRRPCPPSEITSIAAALPADWRMEWLVQYLESSEEFLARGGYPLSGVFDADFPFGVDIL